MEQKCSVRFFFTAGFVIAFRPYFLLGQISIVSAAPKKLTLEHRWDRSFGQRNKCQCNSEQLYQESINGRLVLDSAMEVHGHGWVLHVGLCVLCHFIDCFVVGLGATRLFDEIIGWGSRRGSLVLRGSFLMSVSIWLLFKSLQLSLKMRQLSLNLRKTSTVEKLFS